MITLNKPNIKLLLTEKLATSCLWINHSFGCFSRNHLIQFTKLIGIICSHTELNQFYNVRLTDSMLSR